MAANGLFTVGLCATSTPMLMPQRWGGNQMYFGAAVAPEKDDATRDLPPVPAFVALTPAPDENLTATERLDALFPRYIHEPPKGL